jgi:hypothetical protein
MAVYGLDIFTAVTMISSNNVSELELDSSQARAPTHDPTACRACRACRCGVGRWSGDADATDCRWSCDLMNVLSHAVC